MENEQFKNEIDSWLKDYFTDKGSYEKIIYDSMSYSLNVGGKRIRPILMLLTYSIYKDDYKTIIPVAGALEMIHTYSLIHDDLPCMDNDDLRRGKPTNHKVFGESIAVLAGDGLLNEAGNIMFDFCLNHVDKSVLEACKYIYNAAGVQGMVGGQTGDIINAGKSISEEELNFIHSKKTGALIKAAIISGALLGRADKEELSILDRYGEKLGLAFQIKDDILDVVGDTSVLGKQVGSDESNDKTTFVTLFGIDSCKKLCINLTDECIQLLSSIPRNTSDLKELTNMLLKREF